MNIRKHATAGLLTIGVLVALPASLRADNLAYMLGTAALGVENPLGTVDLNTGAFTLIGNMGSGGYDGLAVANGVLYTEQNGLLYSVNTTNANLTLVGRSWWGGPPGPHGSPWTRASLNRSGPCRPAEPGRGAGSGRGVRPTNFRSGSR